MERLPNFIEWCQQNGLRLEATHKEPIRKGKKVADPNKYSGKVHKTTSDLSNDYKGHYAMNGTVDPYEVKPGKSGKPVGNVAD